MPTHTRWKSPNTHDTPAHSAARYISNPLKQQLPLSRMENWRFLLIQDSVKRQAVGIWGCRSCKKVIAGGAWTVATTTAATVRRYASTLFSHIFGYFCSQKCLFVQYNSSIARPDRGIGPFHSRFLFYDLCPTTFIVARMYIESLWHATWTPSDVLARNLSGCG